MQKRVTLKIHRVDDNDDNALVVLMHQLDPHEVVEDVDDGNGGKVPTPIDGRFAELTAPSEDGLRRPLSGGLKLQLKVTDKELFDLFERKKLVTVTFDL